MNNKKISISIIVIVIIIIAIQLYINRPDDGEAAIIHPAIAHVKDSRAIAKEFIKRPNVEGLRLAAYPDGNGYAIGYGHFGAQPDETCTPAQAEEWLNDDIELDESIISRLVTVPLTTGQRAALISFVFNFGEPKFKSSELLLKLNAGKYNKVPEELERWVYWPDQDGDGEKDILPGLQTRRAWEIKMWNM
jgi:lysozyme